MASDDAPGETTGSARPPAPQPSSHDPARRAFFLEFGRQAVTAAGQVAGVADLVGRTSSEGVADLLGLGGTRDGGTRPSFIRSARGTAVSLAAAPAADDRHRSPYRLAGDELVVVDQRGIPETLDEVTARRGSDVAYYLRLGVARGGPLVAQLAAYGLALTAAERADQPPEQRDLEMRRTQAALAAARPPLRLLRWALERMRSVLPTAGDLTGAEVAQALRAEADVIATDMAAWQAAISSNLVETLAAIESDPLTVLLHGAQGPLHGGVVGTALPALQRLRDEGRALRVFVTEGRPFMDGARLAAWELRQAGIDHTLLTDGAIGWLLDRERVDAVLVSADWVAGNGDVGALVGSRTIALLAAPTQARVIASGPSAVAHAETPDAEAIPSELRPARDLAAYLADVPIRTSGALVPASDVMPAASVDAFVTEHGVSQRGASQQGAPA